MNYPKRRRLTKRVWKVNHKFVRNQMRKIQVEMVDEMMRDLGKGERA